MSRGTSTFFSTALLRFGAAAGPRRPLGGGLLGSRSAPAAKVRCLFDSPGGGGGAALSAQLRDIAGELAKLLWREHTVYRERSGGVVIRAEHVRRWISLAPTGGRDETLVRVGRILDGGTTAPARLEAVVPLSAGTGVLAATCRRLLAEAAADVTPGAPGRAASGRSKGSKGAKAAKGAKRSARPRGSGKHTSFSSWVILVCVAGVIALYVYTTATRG